MNSAKTSTKRLAISENQDWSFDTQQIHSGQTPDPTTGSRSLPIYQTTAYQFRDTAHAANLFGVAEAGNVYTRINNPTQDEVDIGDVRSLVIHPASTTHSQLGKDGLRSARITPGMVRLSIGIEDISDIIADLEKGFAAAKI